MLWERGEVAGSDFLVSLFISVLSVLCGYDLIILLSVKGRRICIFF